MKTAKLENWSVIHDGGVYAAPELHALTLTGTVFGHPVKADGKVVITSPVEVVLGRTVKTSSGTVYELGDAATEYVTWLRDQALPFDPDEPIRMAREEVTRGA